MEGKDLRGFSFSGLFRGGLPPAVDQLELIKAGGSPPLNHRDVFTSPLVGLHQMPVDEDAVDLRLNPGQQKLSLFLDRDVMFFRHADDKVVPLGEAHRKHANFVYHRQPVNLDFQTAVELIERKVDPVRFSDANHETELHGFLRLSSPQSGEMFIATALPRIIAKSEMPTFRSLRKNERAGAFL